MKVGKIVVIFYKELNDVYVFNINNLRLSGISNLELYVAQPTNYFCDAMGRFCLIPADSYLNGAFCIKSNFLQLFQLIDGNKSQLEIVYQIEKCIENSLH